jgi:hypothetical protein
MIDTKKFIEHESLAPLMEPLTSYLQRALETVRRGDQLVHGTDLEKYANAIMGRVSEIGNCFAAMRIAAHEISNLADRLPPKSATLYRYHYENYLLRLSGIFDRVCRLVGEAIRIPSNKLDSAGTNAIVLGVLSKRYPDIHQSLSEIQKLLDEQRIVRNTVAHAEAYSSRELGLYIALEEVAPQGIKLSDVAPLMKNHFVKEAGLLGFLMSDVEARIWALMDHLASIFHEQAAALEAHAKR